jgi:HAD superfamily hydrolase (TIGR01509 family)
MSHRRIRAVLFDMDGVIFDTERLYFSVEKELLARRGRLLSLDLAQRIMGMPGNPAMDLLRRECGLPDTADELVHECEELFRAKLENGLRLMAGVGELLERVERAGLAKAVATSTRRPLAERMLGQFALSSRFAFVLTGDDVAHGKPHPEIYQLACDRLGAAPREALVIEDSLNGTLAAKSAGCICVAVPHPLSRSVGFTHVDLVADSLLDDRLLAMIDGAPA